MREKIWRYCLPWTDGLTGLFASVQEELMSQCSALYPDGMVAELLRSPPSPQLQSVAVPEPTNEFVKEVAVWTVTFRGKTIRLPQRTIGLDYISAILRNEGRPIGALALQSAVAGTSLARKVVENAVDSLQQEQVGDTAAGRELTLSDQDFGRQSILDDKGRRTLQAALLDLEQRSAAALEIGDFEKANSLQDEYDRVQRELELSSNIHGRPRVFKDETEKARVSITKAIRRAYNEIEKHSTELASHLKSSIATGSEFWYRDISTHWKY